MGEEKQVFSKILKNINKKLQNSKQLSTYRTLNNESTLSNQQSTQQESLIEKNYLLTERTYRHETTDLPLLTLNQTLLSNHANNLSSLLPPIQYLQSPAFQPNNYQNLSSFH